MRFEPQPGLVVPITLRVRYGETDQMGVVYHGKYFDYMELGRTEYMRALGVPYRSMEEAGTLFVVVEMQAKLIAPARYDDEVVVRTWVSRLRPSSLVFSYDLALDGAPAGELLATGSTRLACLDARTRRVRGIPDAFADRMRSCLPPT